MVTETGAAAIAEAQQQIGDDRIVRVIIKIRDTIAAVNKEYEDRLDVLKAQKQRLEVELLRRLNERGATQTKTAAGTAFISESMKATVADEDLFKRFCLDQHDVDFFQLRVKVEHLREFMTANAGMLPPGLSVFREATVNVRSPAKKGVKGEPEADS